MLQYQIESMRETVTKLLAYPKPPLEVMIRRDHADHMGVVYKVPNRPVNEKRPSGLYVPAANQCQLVRVKLVDLYQGAFNTEGLDVQLQQELHRKREAELQAANDPHRQLRTEVEDLKQENNAREGGVGS